MRPINRGRGVNYRARLKQTVFGGWTVLAYKLMYFICRVSYRGWGALEFSLPPPRKLENLYSLILKTKFVEPTTVESRSVCIILAREN